MARTFVSPRVLSIVVVVRAVLVTHPSTGEARRLEDPSNAERDSSRLEPGADRPELLRFEARVRPYGFANGHARS